MKKDKEERENESKKNIVVLYKIRTDKLLSSVFSPFSANLGRTSCPGRRNLYSEVGPASAPNSEHRTLVEVEHNKLNTISFIN